MLNLDWCEDTHEQDGVRGVVVVFPGLTSTSESGYIRRCVHTLREATFSVVVISNIGLSNARVQVRRRFPEGLLFALSRLFSLMFVVLMP